ncbi:hypothetical protein D3C85_1396930 [compost metagenome]
MPTGSSAVVAVAVITCLAGSPELATVTVAMPDSSVGLVVSDSAPNSLTPQSTSVAGAGLPLSSTIMAVSVAFSEPSFGMAVGEAVKVSTWVATNNVDFCICMSFWNR